MDKLRNQIFNWTRIRDVSCLHMMSHMIKIQQKRLRQSQRWRQTASWHSSRACALFILWRSSELANMTRGKNTFTSSINHHCMLFVHPGVLELFAVSQGVIGIKGVYSNRFLAMNKRGRLHATVSISNTSQTTSVCQPALATCVYTFHIKLILKIDQRLANTYPVTFQQ